MTVLAGARRVVAVRLDNLGDVVLLTPALRALRQALPRASLSLLASPAGAALAPLLPWVDEVVAFRALWQDASVGPVFDPDSERAAIAQLAAGNWDAAVIFTSFSQSPHPAGYALYLAGVPLRAGLAADFGGGVLSHAIAPPPPGGHQADRSLALLAGLGVVAAGAALELRLPAAAVHAARAMAAEAHLGERYAVLAPGASCASRRYDPERFGQVAAGLIALGLPVAVVGSAREEPLARQVAAAARGAVTLAGRTSVPELAALIAGAALVVTNNSGPLHLADAFARPTVALYAGTEHEAEFTPRASPLRLLRRPTGCAPCRLLTCIYAHECLDLRPAEVLQAATQLLAA